MRFMGYGGYGLMTPGSSPLSGSEIGQDPAVCAGRVRQMSGQGGHAKGRLEASGRFAVKSVGSSGLSKGITPGRPTDLLGDSQEEAGG